MIDRFVATIADDAGDRRPQDRPDRNDPNPTL